MRPLLAAVAGVVGTVLLALTAPLSAAAATPGVVGYDVSWPQCGTTLPSEAPFAVVGVNGGLANNPNPCFTGQLQWAQAMPGLLNQPKAQLYVNTANPGKQAAYWPTSNTSQAQTAVAVPTQYGDCVRKSTGAACAYVYGWSMAENDATVRNVPEPSTFLWWLDVETTNTWSKDLTANRAVLEGMVDYLHSINRTGKPNVGVYSTATQWGRIAGTPPAGSPLLGLPTWVAGATAANASSKCASSFTGGQTRLVQYVENNLDRDVSCLD